MFTRFPIDAHEYVGEKALEAVSGFGFSLLTNHEYCYKHRPTGDEPRECRCNVFWYISRASETRYKQEEAKVGDTFYDGNNGDRHRVVAVDLESRRIVVRNETNLNPECLTIVAW